MQATRLADVHDIGVVRAEVASRAANGAVAELWGALAQVMAGARRRPEVFVGAGERLRAAERVEFAERAAAADLAVRLGMSEATVRAQAFDADTLLMRLPRLWAAFRLGDVSAVNARIAAELVRSLPEDRDAEFDEALSGIVSCAPGRFRARARVLRERLHPVALAERVRVATGTRGVWIDNDLDGMAHLTMRLPADVAHRAFARIDAAARSLNESADETRTLAQLRADVAGDLLVGAGSGAGGVKVSVAVTVPVMTLLDHSDEPGTLDGFGPIDADTARRLTAHAPSFTRLLTHPVTGALLDIDRTTYRPPAHLRRWLRVIDGTCRFPGCTRSAAGSDLDHTTDHARGGPTEPGNLAHLCRHHHRLKHHTGWRVRRGPGRVLTWTSPTGYTSTADPPPF